jgi:hypothetical protein
MVIRDLVDNGADRITPYRDDRVNNTKDTLFLQAAAILTKQEVHPLLIIAG